MDKNTLSSLIHVCADIDRTPFDYIAVLSLIASELRFAEGQSLSGSENREPTILLIGFVIRAIQLDE
ncbi:hypothetical protein BELL_0133g00100 [Botrytis elliptica]|uniref:Uncharacterized protein n=1 Tax=Botrytis elliptica TaxID=278938 RepID=A0A4Z1JTR9_9HELO|nr:hypothetical protein BELL_0133g00100 [Botrytis elliptica]